MSMNTMSEQDAHPTSSAQVEPANHIFAPDEHDLTASAGAGAPAADDARSHSTEEDSPELYCQLATTTRWDEQTPCTVCKRVFATKYQAQKHFMRTHYKGKKEHVCTRCNSKSFAVKEDLTTHQKACGRVFMCSCGMRLRSRATLKRHCRVSGHMPKSWEGYALARPLDSQPTVDALAGGYTSASPNSGSPPLSPPHKPAPTASAAVPTTSSIGMAAPVGLRNFPLLPLLSQGSASAQHGANAALLSQLSMLPPPSMPLPLSAGALSNSAAIDEVVVRVLRGLLS